MAVRDVVNKVKIICVGKEVWCVQVVGQATNNNNKGVQQERMDREIEASRTTPNPRQRGTWLRTRTASGKDYFKFN